MTETVRPPKEAAEIMPAAIHPLQLFNEGGLDPLLEHIERAAGQLLPDDADQRIDERQIRDLMKSVAYKVARSKVVIDDAGAELVADWKAKVAVVDTERRRARQILDDLRDSIKAPALAWEAEEKRLQAEQERQEEIAAVYEEAWEANRQFDQARELEERERQLREEEERIRKEREEVERQKRQAEEIERARQEERERAAQEAQEREERIRKEEQARAEAERQERERARQAELDRKMKAQVEEEERQAAAAADRAHRQLVNRQIRDDLVANGIPSSTANDVVRLAAKGEIPRLSIDYRRTGQ